MAEGLAQHIQKLHDGVHHKMFLAMTITRQATIYHRLADFHSWPGRFPTGATTEISRTELQL